MRRMAAFALLGAAVAMVTGVNAQPPASPPQVTFARDVAPIFQKSCQNCHRPGSIAPMSLLSYEDARPWARSIKPRVEMRQMTPWYVDHTVGIRQFKDDPSLKIPRAPRLGIAIVATLIRRRGRVMSPAPPCCVPTVYFHWSSARRR